MCVNVCSVLFFLFKQKTAYEMRISDWSSDVCSSDLCGDGQMVWRLWGEGPPLVLLHGGSGSWTHWFRNIPALARRYRVIAADLQIGRASCRERVCQYV